MWKKKKKTQGSCGRQRPVNHPPCPRSGHICRLQSAGLMGPAQPLVSAVELRERRCETTTKPEEGGRGSLIERGRGGARMSNCG